VFYLSIWQKTLFFRQKQCKNNKFRRKKREKTQKNQNVKNQRIVIFFANIVLNYNVLQKTMPNSKKF